MLKEEIFDKLINVPVDFSGIAIGTTYYIITNIEQNINRDNIEIYGFNRHEYIPATMTQSFNVDIELLYTNVVLSNKNYGR